MLNIFLVWIHLQLPFKMQAVAPNKKLGEGCMTPADWFSHYIGPTQSRLLWVKLSQTPTIILLSHNLFNYRKPSEIMIILTLFHVELNMFRCTNTLPECIANRKINVNSGTGKGVKLSKGAPPFWLDCAAPCEQAWRGNVSLYTC